MHLMVARVLETAFSTAFPDLYLEILEVQKLPVAHLMGLNVQERSIILLERKSAVQEIMT